MSAEPGERRELSHTRRRLPHRLWRLFIWGVGLISIAFGIAGAVLPDDGVPRGAALTLVPCGAGFLAWAAMPIAARRRPATVTVRRFRVRGDVQVAVVIPSSRARWLLMPVALACFATGGLGPALFPDQFDGDPRWTQFAGVAIAGFLGALAVIALTVATIPPFIALLADGVVLGAGRTRAFVPWETIEMIAIHQDAPPAHGGIPPPEEEWPSYLRIWVADLDAVELPRWIRVLLGVRRSRGTHLSAAIDGLAVPPERLEDVIRRLRSSAVERQRLLTPDGRAEVERMLRRSIVST